MSHASPECRFSDGYAGDTVGDAISGHWATATATDRLADGESARFVAACAHATIARDFRARLSACGTTCHEVVSSRTPGRDNRPGQRGSVVVQLADSPGPRDVAQVEFLLDLL